MTTSREKAVRPDLLEIGLYSPEESSGIDIPTVKDYIGSLFPAVRVKVLPSITSGLHGSCLKEFATCFASARVKDPSKRAQSFEAMYGEVDYERRAISGNAKVGGVVYDGFKIERLCRRLLDTKASIARCSVVFTERLLSTYSQDDMRHHLRTVVCGFPSLISIPGIVEAPAKPREYYLMRRELEAAGAGELELARLRFAFKGRFIDHDDSLMDEVLKGLALQAVVFHLTLRPFCDDTTCRLYNAHWQEELIESQIESGELCSFHARLVRHLGREPRLAW